MRWIGFVGSLMSLLCLNVGVSAEGGCPSGMQPYQPSPNRYSCMPIPGGGGSSRGPAFNSGTSVTSPNSHWEDRWGALATDEPRGVLGATTGMVNEQVARQAALSECKSKGGLKCLISHSYKNGCASLTGSWTSFQTMSGPNLEMVVSDGIKSCVDAGLQGCRTFYSACSLPVLVRD